MVVQSTEETPYDFSIRKIDFLNNPEFEQIKQFYTLPVMFK